MAGCDGPNGSRFDGERCVSSSAMTSCDELAGQTCWYCYVLDAGKSVWFSGEFLSGSGLKIHEPAALAGVGIGPGDFVNKINGVLLTDEATLLAALALFTETNPATVFSATHLLGKYQLTLSH